MNSLSGAIRKTIPNVALKIYDMYKFGVIISTTFCKLS